MKWEPPRYQNGFGNNHFESEAVDGALPRGRNNPRHVPLDLYTEQLSGTAFTRPRTWNQRTWLYRQQPSVVSNGERFKCQGSDNKYFGNADPSKGIVDPNPLRWLPFDDDDDDDDDDKSPPKDFVTGMHLLGASGDPTMKNGIAIYVYVFQKRMESHLYNSDGDFLIVPQQGTLNITTELGKLQVKPTEIGVIPRGIVFSVQGNESGNVNRGYVLEIYKGHFQLPELGPIGSNGLANARDFQYPVAWFDPNPFQSSILINKVASKVWTKPIHSSPYNVVAWHGNYLPFKYDLKLFCAVNSVTYDHLDPSIYTVLTVPGDEPGTALCDFVIFPPRWMSTDENTFRPPWFHRNVMTEFMGLIDGSYDAKQAFAPGGASLHPCMTPHGPDSVSYDKAISDPCNSPTRFEGGLAFMFETACMLRLSDFALSENRLDVDYGLCWRDFDNHFRRRDTQDDEPIPSSDDGKWEAFH